MTDREELCEERRQEMQVPYAITTLEQAEVAGAALARFCMTFLDTIEGQGLLSEEALRLLLAGIAAGYGR